MVVTITPNSYVDIPCLSGKHQRSMVTFRNSFVAVMFCPSCEHGWIESGDHPSLSLIDIKRSEGQET